MSMLRGDEAPAAGFPNSSLVSDCEPYQMDSETREPISHPLARPSGMNWPVAQFDQGITSVVSSLIGIHPRDPMTI